MHPDASDNVLIFARTFNNARAGWGAYASRESIFISIPIIHIQAGWGCKPDNIVLIVTLHTHLGKALWIRSAYAVMQTLALTLDTGSTYQEPVSSKNQTPGGVVWGSRGERTGKSAASHVFCQQG